MLQDWRNKREQIIITNISINLVLFGTKFDEKENIEVKQEEDIDSIKKKQDITYLSVKENITINN